MGKTLGNMRKDSSYCLNNEISKTEPKEELSTELYLKKITKKRLNTLLISKRITDSIHPIKTKESLEQKIIILNTNNTFHSNKDNSFNSNMSLSMDSCVSEKIETKEESEEKKSKIINKTEKREIKLSKIDKINFRKNLWNKKVLEVLKNLIYY